MRRSWIRKSPLAKLATIFATGFVVSLGLCGINFLIVAGGAGARAESSSVFFVTAYLELAGMTICAAGLMFLGLIAIIQAVSFRFSDSPDSSDKDK